MKQTGALKQEILALEMRYWDAVKERDAATAARLSDDPCIVVGAQGVGELRQEALAALMKLERCTVNDYAIEDVHLRELGDDVVALAYTVSENVTVDGQTLEFKAHDASVWKRQADGWICVLHTETPAGDPFGRH